MCVLQYIQMIPAILILLHSNPNFDNYNIGKVRSEVPGSVRMTVLFFWVVNPLRLLHRYQSLGETFRHHL